MNKILLSSLLTLALVGFGCGDDDGGTDGGGGDTDGGGTMTDGGGTVTDGGGGDTDGGGGDTDGGGGDTDGGMTMSDGGASAAATFCGTYETTCTYGGENRFADEAACLAYYEAAAEGCVTCIEMHLGLAGADAATHCPHAMGMGPCAAMCGG